MRKFWISIWSQCKIIRRIIGKFADSWGLDLMSDFSLRRMTGNSVNGSGHHHHNVWNIDEKEYQKIADAVPGQNQELPESTGSRLQKHN
jgi:hypothetical protein